jgi:hypothetical protein
MDLYVGELESAGGGGEDALILGWCGLNRRGVPHFADFVRNDGWVVWVIRWRGVDRRGVPHFADFVRNDGWVEGAVWWLRMGVGWLGLGCKSGSRAAALQRRSYVPGLFGYGFYDFGWGYF